MKNLQTFDIVIVVVYLFLFPCLGYWIGKKQKTSEDYFLGGRKLRWWMVGISMVVTDIGALELVGVAGSAYGMGLAMANFDWIGCVPAMVLAAFLFIPLYWKAGVYTIPEYLGRRYNDGVRTLIAILWGLFLVANLGIFLWSAATVLEVMLGWPKWVSILITGSVVGLYTFFGGLEAVVMADMIQYANLMMGSIIILVVGLIKVGGIDGLVETVQAVGGPERKDFFHLLLPASTTHPMSWSAVFFGLALVLSPAYWVGNQAIVQRNLGTGNARDAKKSVLFGAALKLTIPILIVIPGMVGFALYPNLPEQDKIYPYMLQNMLPPGLLGLVFAGFLVVVMSGADAYLNSASTLWTMDVYKKYIHKDADQRHLYKVGRILTAAFIGLAVLMAPLTDKFEGVFSAMQTLLSLFQGPTFAILLLGMIWKGANSYGAIAGLVAGLITSFTLFWIKDGIFQAANPFLFIAWWSFVAGVVATIAVSLFTPSRPANALAALTWSSKGS